MEKCSKARPSLVRSVSAAIAVVVLSMSASASAQTPTNEPPYVGTPVSEGAPPYVGTPVSVVAPPYVGIPPYAGIPPNLATPLAGDTPVLVGVPPYAGVPSSANIQVVRSGAGAGETATAAQVELATAGRTIPVTTGDLLGLLAMSTLALGAFGGVLFRRRLH